jgi:hypothetical protein
MSEEEKGMPAAKPKETKPDEAPKEQRETAEPLAGFQIQLEEDGQITRRLYGSKQNMASMFGLVRIIENEITAMASAMPGQTPSRETRLLSNVVTSMTNMANVLMGLQAGLNQIIQRMEEMANDKPEPELENSPREEVPTEGPGE